MRRVSVYLLQSERGFRGSWIGDGEVGQETLQVQEDGQLVDQHLGQEPSELER